MAFSKFYSRAFQLQHHHNFKNQRSVRLSFTASLTLYPLASVWCSLSLILIPGFAVHSSCKIECAVLDIITKLFLSFRWITMRWRGRHRRQRRQRPRCDGDGVRQARFTPSTTHTPFPLQPIFSSWAFINKLWLMLNRHTHGTKDAYSQSVCFQGGIVAARCWYLGNSRGSDFLLAKPTQQSYLNRCDHLPKEVVIFIGTGTAVGNPYERAAPIRSIIPSGFFPFAFLGVPTG